MGLCLLLTLIVLGYSLNVQSPRRGAGFQMEPYRREARVRALTVTAFALLLVMVGFFVAGVPLDGEAEPAVAQVAPTQAASGAFETVVDSAESDTPSTPVSGAFGQALVQEDEADPVVEATSDNNTDETTPAPEAASDEQEPLVEATATPEPPTATPTEEPTLPPSPTPTPTETPIPTPTLTPTPIVGETARVNTDGSTLWVKRSPGGQNVVIVQDGDLLILLSGNANQSGMSWKQIKTVNGIEGWVERIYLAFDDDAAESDE